MSDHESDNLFRQGRYDDAVQRLKKGYEDQGESGRDSLLYILDLGLALHSAGRYEESNKVFLQADKLAEIKDYTSIATEAGTLLTSDNIKSYKAEDFENVLINTYLAMNYALMGDWENSLVEARRVNQKLYMMVSEGKRKYKQNAFARYLSAAVYEADGNFEDAYVDYKNTHDLMPGFPGLGKDLWRCARINGIEDDLEKWDEEYSLTRADHDAAMAVGPKSRKAEIIVLYENGISPIKRPNPQFRELPRFFPRANPVRMAEVDINGQPVANTLMLENIEATAIENLDEKYGGMIAKKLAGIVAKEVVAHEIERKSKLLGLVSEIAMFASDQADVRSWNLLPRDLQIARIPVDAGTYTVRVRAIGAGFVQEKTVQLAAGKKSFVGFRYMP